MNGAHDMGGMHGMGPIERERDEPVFHAEWERRAFAVTLAMGFHGRWTLDRSRYERENRHPLDYLSSSYYELWLKALESLLLEHGFLRADEIEAGRALAPPPPTGTPADPATVAAALRRGATARLPDEVPPRFKCGDVVRVRDMTTTGHTRAPRYCRGRSGVIERDHGVFSFPDTLAAGLGKKPQHLYNVRFDATSLWGDAASPRDSVRIDLWDDYLEPCR
jgi:nitrile hydratase beta subunit